MATPARSIVTSPTPSSPGRVNRTRGRGVLVVIGAGRCPQKNWEERIHANAAEGSPATTVNRIAYRAACRLAGTGERLDHGCAAGASGLRATAVPHRRIPMDARLLGLRSSGVLLGARRVARSAATRISVDARLL